MLQATYLMGDKWMDLIDFKILNTAIERLLNKELTEFGITYTQATVIGYLKQNLDNEIFQKDIEYNLGLTHSTVSILLSRMEEKQMVVMKSLATDRRYKSVALTPQALEISEQIHRKIQQITEMLFDGVSAEEQSKMNATMKKIIQNIK